MIKVRELIEKLQQQDQEAVVVVYENEDWAGALDVWTKEQAEHPEERLYCKGGYFSEVMGESVRYVVIADMKVGD